jgi:Flp pilus assembly protein TadD
MTAGGRIVLASVLLVLLTAAVFHSVLGFGFLGLDDPRFVTANGMVQKGLTAQGVRWAFTTTQLGFYAPVTALSHMLDCQLYGLRGWGHHLTSLLLHAASALLLLLALHRMTGALGRSFFVAALFAVHPLHVEPVAWIAERKELLCGFFWIAALLAYAVHAAAPSARRYVVVFAFYILALLSKSMAVTLPFALLLLDLWPLGRWPGNARGPGRPARLSALILEKTPMLLPIPLLSLLTVRAQTEMGALGSSEAFPPGERIANALYAYGAYLLKTVFPVRLAALYPFEHGAMPVWKPACGALALIAGTTAAVLLFLRARSRLSTMSAGSPPGHLPRTCGYVTTGLLWYAGTLVPVIGLVHVGSQSMADRYTYVPLIGIFILLVWGASDALSSASAGIRRGALALAGLIVVALGTLAHAQTLTWRDDEALYTRVLSVSPKAILAYYNLGNFYLFGKGDPGRAIGLYEQALSIDPRYGDVQLGLGTALAREGRTGEALDHFREAVRLKPDLAEARMSLANALMQSRLLPEAEGAFHDYLALRPDDWRGYSGLGLLYGEMGDWGKAAMSLARAAELAPREGTPVSLLGYALMKQGDKDGARRALARALSIEPSQPQPYYYLGLMALESGDLAGAQAQLDALRRLDPALARSLEAAIGQGHGSLP